MDSFYDRPPGAPRATAWASKPDHGRSYASAANAGRHPRADHPRNDHREQREPREHRERQPHPAPEKLEFKEDFDFEKGNAQLQGMLDKLHLEDTPQAALPEVSDASCVSGPTRPRQASSAGGAVDAFYDPGSSFFDNISCESLERKNGVQQRLVHSAVSHTAKPPQEKSG